MRQRVGPRIKKRTAVLLALAAAGASAVVGIALASASSTVFLNFLPNSTGPNFTSGKLVYHTATSYGAGTETKRIQVFLDDDFQFNPNSFPKCDPADISGNITMKQALQRCGPTAGAAKNAWLWPASSTTSNGTAKVQVGNDIYPGCVLVFNGLGSTSEVLLFIRLNTSSFTINCSNPGTNQSGDASMRLKGDLKPNPADIPATANDADYTDPDACSAPDPRRGCQIDISNINTSAPFSPAALADLTVAVQRGNYVRARCVDAPHVWSALTRFSYVNPASGQTVIANRGCS